MAAVAAALAGRAAARAGGRACQAESSGRGLPWRPAQRPRRQHRRRAAPAAAAGPQAEVDMWGEPIGKGEIGIVDDDFYVEEGLPDGVEGRSGYTPFDFIEFSDTQLRHELVTKVDRPVSEVYALWSDRLNWPSWFTMIDEVGFAEGDPDVCALNLWYRWAMTPWLELYVALRRTEAETDKFIVEQPEDGAPLLAAALFQEAEDGGTTVTLRVAYLLPRVLFEFAGAMAVFGDVDRKLAQCMARMKADIEGCDAAAAVREGQAAMAKIRADLPQHKRQQDEYDRQWEADKQLRKQQEAAAEQRAAAAAVAAAQRAEQQAAQEAAEASATTGEDAELEQVLAAAAQMTAQAAEGAEAEAEGESSKPRRGRKPAGGGAGKGRPRGSRKPGGE